MGQNLPKKIESAKLRALRSHVPACHACSRASVSCVLTCSLVNVTCSRANVPCALMCQRALRAYVVIFGTFSLSFLWEIKFIWKVYTTSRNVLQTFALRIQYIYIYIAPYTVCSQPIKALQKSLLICCILIPKQ